MPAKHSTTEASVRAATREDTLEFIEAMVTEMLKLSLRANFRTLVYILGMAKVAAAEARRGKSTHK
jgi:hypothetical protein